MTLVTKRLIKLLKNANYVRTSKGHSLYEQGYYGGLGSHRVVQISAIHTQSFLCSANFTKHFYISDTMTGIWILRVTQKWVEKDKVSVQGIFTI